MGRNFLCGLVLAVLSGTAAFAQQPGGYLEVLTVKVKPEKRTEFDAVVRKVAEANRRYGGDIWIASEVAYGEGNTVSFTMPRRSFEDSEKGMEMFMGALAKAFGPAGSSKIFQDFNSCVVSTRSEIRRRRPDLSVNAPTDQAALEKAVAGARWIRTTALHLLPGRAAAVEAQLKEVRDKLEKADPQGMTGIAQSLAGSEGPVIYINTFRPSLGAFDKETPLPQILGPEEYEKLRQNLIQSVQSVETTFSRFVPELSNPPQSFLTASPDFWTPRPTALAKATPETAKPAEKNAEKKK